jgi:EAL domain-containing protein (putative c-di-GMP-specific phosphodiesterase class I)
LHNNQIIMKRDTLTAQEEKSSKPPTSESIIGEALHSVRTLLGMDVAFVSEFHSGRRIFRYVDCSNQFMPVEVGASDPVEETYCQRVVDGRLPELLEDVLLNHEASSLPVTARLGIGMYLGVPIRLSDNTLYGTFCCYSAQPSETPNDYRLATLRLFAEFVGKILERETTELPHRELKRQISEAIEKESFTLCYQPIVDIVANRTIGHEALVRFSVAPEKTPEQWFLEAAQVDCQQELELAIIRKAVHALPHLPAGTYLSLNLSPATILKGGLPHVLENMPLDRIVVEVTEHALINDYFVLSAQLEPLREKGLRVAVDDAGAGFASFRHIMKLKPDIIKLDSSLIHQIDDNREARALSAALIRFAEEIGCDIVAEGVETASELRVLRELSVRKAQGYFLGRPEPMKMQEAGQSPERS